MRRTALLSALLLGLMLVADAIDPRACIPGDEDTTYYKIAKGRPLNKYAYNDLKALVQYTNELLMLQAKYLTKGCKMTSWEASAACWTPNKAGKKPPNRGTFGYNWSANYVCKKGSVKAKTTLLFAGYVDTRRNGLIKDASPTLIWNGRLIPLN